MSFLFFLPGLEYATRTQLHTEKVSCWQLALWASAWSQSSEYEVPKPYFRNRSSYSETRPCVRHWEPKSPGTHDDKHQLSYFPPWGTLLPKKNFSTQCGTPGGPVKSFSGRFYPTGLSPWSSQEENSQFRHSSVFPLFNLPTIFKVLVTDNQ